MASPVTEKNLIGVGLYTVPEAARLLHLNTNRLKRWVSGYDYTLRNGASRHSPPMLSLQVGEVGDQTVLTFQDLIELHFIKLFSKHGVSMPVIRAAAVRASQRYGSSNPFTVERFQTDGKVIFSELTSTEVEDTPPDKLVEETHLGQTVVEHLAKPFYKKLDYEDYAQGWWPLGKDGRVTLNAKRAFGKPIDAEFGIETDVLYRMVLKVGSPQKVADWFGVSEDAVNAATEFEAEWTQKAA